MAEDIEYNGIAPVIDNNYELNLKLGQSITIDCKDRNVDRDIKIVSQQHNYFAHYIYIYCAASSSTSTAGSYYDVAFTLYLPSPTVLTSVAEVLSALSTYKDVSGNTGGYIVANGIRKTASSTVQCRTIIAVYYSSSTYIGVRQATVSSSGSSSGTLSVSNLSTAIGSSDTKFTVKDIVVEL